jgi:hypothetical protein
MVLSGSIMGADRALVRDGAMALAMPTRQMPPMPNGIET